MHEIQLILNGQPQNVQAKTLSELLKELKLPQSHLAVALNNEVIPQSEIALTSIQNGDHVEIVRAVCGG